MPRPTAVVAVRAPSLSAGGLPAQALQGAGGHAQWGRTGSGTVTLAGTRDRRAEIPAMIDSDGDGRLAAADLVRR